MREGLDYAWGWGPGKGKQIAASGATFVARYLANLPNSKVITKAEVADLSAAGLGIVLVWETTTGRARAGMEAGAHDATEALRQARALGVPDDRPLYFAVDEDTTAYAVGGYFHGVWSVLGDGRVGVYGGYAVCKGLLDCGAVTWAWQTYAWSGGKWDSRAQLQQYHNGVRVAGLDCDNNRATMADFGQWGAGEQPTPGGDYVANVPVDTVSGQPEADNASLALQAAGVIEKGHDPTHAAGVGYVNVVLARMLAREKALEARVEALEASTKP